MNIMAFVIFAIINGVVAIHGANYDHCHPSRIPRGLIALFICFSFTLPLFYYMGWFGNV